MTICILGRQPELGLAELESLYGAEHVRPVGNTCALVDAAVNFARLGGSVKAGSLLATLPNTNRKAVFKELAKQLPALLRSLPQDGKIKLGISLYGFDLTPYELGGEALRLKKIVRATGRSVRVVPNESPALSSAQTYHNSLAGDLGLEFMIVRDGDQTLIGRVTDVQNIDSYRIRDRERPKRDAFVGMLPPKLAQIIVNLAVGKTELRAEKAELRKSQENQTKESQVLDLSSQICILDPFCGTGVVLQEAMLMGYDAYGTDISPKMVDYTKANLGWLQKAAGKITIEQADATTHAWDFLRSPDLTISRSFHVASETYLGQPLGGQHPSKEKLAEIVYDTNAIVRDFLKNIAPQLSSGSRLCLAVPAWHTDDALTRLPLVDDLESLGFRAVPFTHSKSPLIYRREDQVTGRELLVLVKL